MFLRPLVSWGAATQKTVREKVEEECSAEKKESSFFHSLSQAPPLFSLQRLEQALRLSIVSPFRAPMESVHMARLP